MQLTRRKHVGIHVSLCALAEIFVFFKHLPVEVADLFELLVGSVLVSVYLVLDFARGW